MHDSTLLRAREEEKMVLREKKQRGGSNVSRNPKAERRAEGGPGKQEQAYPGSDAKLQPRADMAKRRTAARANSLAYNL